MTSKAPLYPIWALVREIRSRTGLTQHELAERSGVSQPNISSYERARSLPDIPTLTTLAEAARFDLHFELREPDLQRHGRVRSFDEGIEANARALAIERALRNADPSPS